MVIIYVRIVMEYVPNVSLQSWTEISLKPAAINGQKKSKN